MSKLGSAIQALKQGAVIAYPTEAVYGLGCDPLNKFAVLHLLALKNRAIAKGLILIAANIEQIIPYIRPLSSECMQPILDTWPGPFTWVFPATELVPEWIHGGHNTIAVRVTAHPVAKALCTDFGRPIVSTSANLQGQPPACDASSVVQIFPHGIEIIVPGRVGELNQPTQIRDAVSGVLIRQ